ncbi:NADPH--cytochrome P450 reductase-like isoform X2 [Ptychodera flava]
MASVETDQVQEQVAEVSEEPVVGMLDIFLLCMCVGIVVYWFFFRSEKKPETQTVKKLTVMPTVSRTNDPSFINKMKNSGKNMVIFYGSQTGTAEEFAGRLAKDAQRYGMKAMVADPEECDMEDLNRMGEIENSFAVFCLATYGEGDPTDNAQEMYEWLQEGNSELGELNFAVFGLGNKTYEHYNAVGIFADRRLEELRAKRVFELGLGDDDGNLEEDFVTWKEKFWVAVCDHFGVEATGEEGSIRQYSVTYFDDLAPEKLFTGEAARLNSFKNQKPPYDAKNPYLAPVQVNRELHKGGDRSCMHIELDITGSRIRYEAGDHVAVYPINDAELVHGIGQVLGVDLDRVFSLNNVDEEASKKHPFPCPCSFRTALSHYVDITNPPRTNVLRDLADYATDPKDKEFLLRITAPTPDGKKEYSEWIVKDQRDILTILQDLPSVKPPLDHLCELLPRLQARFYSISSSPKLHPESIHVTAVLVDYRTRTGRYAKGVATTWLKTKIPNGPQKPTVPIYVRKSQFRLPFKPTTPVIMVGPGTGLAPFRGFIQERHHSKEQGKDMGETVLYFGCRHKAQDFIYQEELEKYHNENSLTELNLAFSRDQAQKVYVQHLLKQNSSSVWKLIEKGAHFYICGDARNMARDVNDLLKEIFVNEGEMTKDQAEDYYKKMQSKGRYAADVWS